MRAARSAALAACGLAVVLAGCPDRADRPPRRRDAGVAGPRARTVPPLPEDDVRVYPPYAIRSDGVGPYNIDSALADVLQLVGPRSETLEVPGVLSWRLVPAEDGRLLIGADERTRRVDFIVVLSPEVARTDNGMTVGVSGATLLAAFGPAREAPDVVRARRVYEFEKLPNVQFLTDAAFDRPDAEARVIAVLVARPAPAAPPSERLATVANKAASPACRDGGALAKVAPAELWAVAHAGKARAASLPPPPTPPRVRWACVTGAGPEALVLSGDELSIVGGEPGKLRRIAALTVGAVDQVAPLDADGDGKDEIVLLTGTRSDELVTTTVRVLGWDGTRPAPLASERVFAIDREQAATAGATPATIQLWPEVRRGDDGLMVGGLYAAGGGAGPLVVAPVAARRLRLDSKKLPAAPGEAATPEAAPGGDAGAEPGGKHHAPDAGRRGPAPGPDAAGADPTPENETP
jgi:hypothetical protein